MSSRISGAPVGANKFCNNQPRLCRSRWLLRVFVCLYGHLYHISSRNSHIITRLTYMITEFTFTFHPCPSVYGVRVGPEATSPKIGLAASPSGFGGCLDQESLGGHRARRSPRGRRLWGRDPSTVEAAPARGETELFCPVIICICICICIWW